MVVVVPMAPAEPNPTRLHRAALQPTLEEATMKHDAQRRAYTR